MSTRRHRIADLLIAFGVGLAAFALYLRTLAPGLLWGDSAEFQLAAWLGGFAHPTGYPLYLMLGWLWTHLLPLGDPAWRMNLFSALWGGVAVGLVYLLAARILQTQAPTRPAPLAGREGGDASPSPLSRGGRGVRCLALAAAFIFAVSPTFWSQAVVTEVYTLNAAFVAAILLAALAWADRPGWPRLYLLAGLIGLSLAHHRTTLLLLPGLVVFLGLEWGFRRAVSAFKSTHFSSENVAEHPLGELRADAHAGRGATAPAGENVHRNRASPALAPKRSAGASVRRFAPLRTQPAKASIPGRRSVIFRAGSSTAPRALPWLRPGCFHVLGADSHLARRLLIAAAFLLAPLLLYAYIPLVAPRAPYFTVALGPEQTLALYEPTLSGFLAHISGSIFGSALGAARGPWLAELAGRLAGEVTWPGVALGIVGILWLAWRHRRTAALTGLSFVAFVGFNALYAIGDIHVFYIPAYLIWVLWLGVGAWACGRLGSWTFASLSHRTRSCAPAPFRVSRSAAQREKPAEASSPRSFTSFVAMLTPILLLALAGWLLTANFARVDRSADRTARTAWDAVLAQPIPQDAILITNDRDEMVPQWYLRYVEGRRADLTGLFPLIQPGPQWSDVAAVTGQALGTGRPVYLIKPMPGLEVKFSLAPVDMAADGQIGALVRVEGLAAQGQLAHASGVTFGEQVRLIGYEAQPAEVSAGQALEVILEWEVMAPPAHDYTTFVHLVNAEGRVIGQSDHRAGGVYYPTSLWRTGERLRDAHQLRIADDLGPGPYAVEVGLYRLAPDLQHLGSPLRVGELGACG